MKSDIIKLGRVVGLDNVVRFRDFAKTVKSADFGVYKTRLKYENSYDSYIASLEHASEDEALVAGYLMGLIYQYCPRSTAKNVENVIDIVVKKFAKDKAKINVSLFATDKKGIFERINLNILRSNKTAKFDCNSEAEAFKMKTSGYISGMGNAKVLLNELFKNLHYEEHKGVSKATAQLKNIGNVRDLNAEAEVSTNLLEQLMVLFR